MHKIPLVLAVLALTAGTASAASLTPEQAVAFLLVGVQVGQQAEVSGIPFTWAEPTPGRFTGSGTNGTNAMELSVDVDKSSSCVYDFAMEVGVDKQSVFNAKATYDFGKITGMKLIAPDTAEITGTGYCVSAEAGVCDPKISLAVPTDDATFDAAYREFRKETCN